jgi:hypothetical protein
MIGVIAFGDDTLDQFVREGDVVALSERADQAHRIAQGVAGGVDFGAQAAAGAAVDVRPPFSRRAPAAC